MADAPSSSTAPPHPAVERATFDCITARDLHDILRLRSAVFVVEQRCVFLDIDGRDVEPGTEQLWMRDEDGIVASARLVSEGGGTWSIGRVVARPDRRSSGAASALMRRAVAVLDERGCPRIVLGAQSHLADWYARFGFSVSGAEYVEDGIAHVPMRRERP